MTTHLSSSLVASFQRSLKSAIHFSTKRCGMFPHLQAHLRRIPIPHPCFHGRDEHFLHCSGTDFFFNTCLQELVIVRRKNDYLNRVLVAGTEKAEKHRGCFCMGFLFCFTVMQVDRRLNPKLNHKAIRRA